MADTRTKRQKLEAMAAQTGSPAEAEVAKRKLRAMDGKPPPRKRTSPRYEQRTNSQYGNLTEADIQEALRRMHEEVERLRKQREQDIQKVLFAGGPWHGQQRPVSPEKQAVEAPIIPTDFATYWRAEQYGPNLTMGIYERTQTRDGKDIFVWRG